jgi:hypothetical protein
LLAFTSLGDASAAAAARRAERAAGGRDQLGVSRTSGSTARTVTQNRKTEDVGLGV